MAKNSYVRGGARLEFGDALKLCESWPSPTVIIADGPYGLSSFPGDPPTADALSAWYQPHLERWAAKSTPQTTLWFWNSELGWATVHPAIVAAGWRYRSCHVWDKGIGHIAGNANSKTLRKFPVVTEVCVQYVREAEFQVDGRRLTMQDWLRHEWKRSGLPLYLANEACGVTNAATRKYLTNCHLWYYPPVEAFVRLAAYANRHGNARGRPYFSMDGKAPVDGSTWERMRSKFYCEVGITNVWREPQVRGLERVAGDDGCAHMNQKPLRLLEMALRATSDENDVVWEPFGGLCSAAVAAYRLDRRCYSAEIVRTYFDVACARLASTDRADLFAQTRGNKSPGRHAHRTRGRRVEYAHGSTR